MEFEVSLGNVTKILRFRMQTNGETATAGLKYKFEETTKKPFKWKKLDGEGKLKIAKNNIDLGRQNNKKIRNLTWSIF